MAFQVASGMARRSLRRSMKLLGQKEQVRLQKEVVSTSICSTNRENRDTASARGREALVWAGSIRRPLRSTAASERNLPWGICGMPRLGARLVLLLLLEMLPQETRDGRRVLPYAGPAKRSPSQAWAALSSRGDSRNRSHAPCSCQTGTSSQTQKVGLWAPSRGKSSKPFIAPPSL